jgi:alkanesulfonate monooxygenase SsuD/methylene tetrahydromethanopterin reductase-like flavin-dependent oxidoreductase (luciferase family)
MKVGIGLPNAVPGSTRDSVVAWSQRAEAAGFSSLGTIDRINYPNYESIVALSAAAAVTERIALVTDILLAPLRSNTALLAKQAATLDSLSNGRLVMGLGAGGRPDDFEVSDVPFHERGKIFDRQLLALKEFWGGKLGPEPAQPGGPPIFIGGGTPAAFRRAAEHGVGWTMGGGTPEEFKQGKTAVEEEWRKRRREGTPRTMALFYAALGPNAEELAQEDLLDYYAWLGEEIAGWIVAGSAKDADTVRSYLAGFEAEGCDEVIIFPVAHSLEQVDLIAEAAL